MKDATIRDVARAADVSIKTVSRVLNGEPNVRSETRDAVNKAVARLKYRPNLAARSLAGSRSRLIALIYDNTNTGYVASLQLGAIERCRASGYHLMVEPLDLAATVSALDISKIIGTVRIDGAILAPPVSDSAAVMKILDAARVPYVRIAPATDRNRSACVEMDDGKAAHAMTSHLISLGHTRIGFIEGPTDHGATHRRKKGFMAAMQDHGVKVVRKRIVQGAFTFRSGFDCAEALLNQADRPTAIFASNDDMALGVMSYAHRLGLTIPADLSVAGFDDAPAAAAIWPPLTTVRQPTVDMAGTAAEFLVTGSASRHRPARPIERMLDFELVVRSSTAPVAAQR